MHKLFVLAKNSLVETIRQPVYAVIIIVALLLFALSPAISMYTMGDDNKLLRELGLSTLFLASLFIAVFAACGTVAQEIDNKTILTVLTKPVHRPIFILAKFLGVCGAVILAHYICTISLLMVIRHGILETVNDTCDWTVLIPAIATAGLTFFLTAFLNYIYDWRFSSTAVVLLAVFLTVSMAFLVCVDKSWQFNIHNNSINIVDIYGAVLLLPAALIIAALAVAISTRFNMPVTLSACSGIFLLGLVSDYAFGRLAADHIWAQAGRYIVPNLQIFWISDAIYEGSTVPAKYILITFVYALCYAAGIIALAIALFQRRQVG